MQLLVVELTSTISRNGDLVGRMYLQIDNLTFRNQNVQLYQI